MKRTFPLICLIFLLTPILTQTGTINASVNSQDVCIKEENMQMKLPQTSFIYKKGDTYIQLLSCKDKLKGTNAPNLTEVFAEDKKEVSKFRSYLDYYLWSGLLLRNGEEIRMHLDLLLSSANNMTDSFFSSKYSLEKELEKLNNYKQSIRNYDYDTQEFISIYSVSGISENVSQIMILLSVTEEINRIYNRVFIQLRQKIGNITNARVSATNMLLSFVAIVIACISLRHNKRS